MASSVPVLSREESNFLRVANLIIRVSPKAVRILFDKEFNPVGLKLLLQKNRTKLDKLKREHVITRAQWSLLFPLSIQTEEISEWKKKLEKFYVTEAATSLIKVVKENQCTIITGIPGSGKSALAYYAAIHMQETEGYTVLPFWSPSELIKIANHNAKQLFVFDDAFGKYSLNEYNLNCWESEAGRIKMLLKNQGPKIMVTCKSYLYNCVSENIICALSFAHFNLQSDGISLSLIERKEISKLYLTDDVICQLDDKVLLMYNFFPLLCFMFKKHNIAKVSFFQNPDLFVKNEVAHLKSKQDLSFLTLALLVISNNSIKKDSLMIGRNAYDDMLQDLSDEIGIKKTPTKKSMMTNLQNLKEIYLKETDSTFCSNHDKIFDIISHTIGKYIIGCILTHGKPAFISSRCQLNSLNEHHNDFTIIIREELEAMYFERLLKDIAKGFIWETFANIQMKFEKYRNLLVQYLKKSNTKYSSAKIDQATPLHVAAAKGYYDISKYLVEYNKKQIGLLDSKERSPLHNASMNGRHEIVNLLIRNGAKVNQIDIDGYTPLLRSCDSGFLKVIEILLNQHANVDICGKDGWYPLHMAAKDGNSALIKLLVKYKADVNKKMTGKITPLYLACNSSHFEAVKVLLEYKANVNICADNGWSPLAIACRRGCEDIAEALISNCDDVNKKEDTNGQSPLFSAITGKHTNLVELLLKHDLVINEFDSATALHMAFGSGSEDMVKLLLKNGVSNNVCVRNGPIPAHFAYSTKHQNLAEPMGRRCDEVNKGDDDGKTPLYFAVIQGSTDLIKILIEHGASVNLETKDGVTPINAACQYNQLEAVKMLNVKYKADVNKCDVYGCCPLHVVSFCNKKELAAYLCDNSDAKVNLTNKNGKTPLHFACKNCNDNIVEILLNHGANVNKCDVDGCSPLHLASYFNQKEIATLLCEKGALVNLSNKNGETPLHIACMEGFENIADILLQNGALNCFHDKNKQTPIEYACSNNHRNIAMLILKSKTLK